MAVRLEVLAPLVGRPAVVRALQAQLIRDVQRHEEGYFQSNINTFALPTRQERLVSVRLRGIDQRQKLNATCFVVVSFSCRPLAVGLADESDDVDD